MSSSPLSYHLRGACPGYSKLNNFQGFVAVKLNPGRAEEQQTNQDVDQEHTLVYQLKTEMTPVHPTA